MKGITGIWKCFGPVSQIVFAGLSEIMSVLFMIGCLAGIFQTEFAEFLAWLLILVVAGVLFRDGFEFFHLRQLEIKDRAKYSRVLC